MTASSRTPLAALALCAPALALVVSGLLQTATGAEVVSPPDWLIHPALVLGGLVLTIGLAAMDVLRVRVQRSAESIAFQIVIRRRPGALAMLGLAVILVGVIGAYGIAENLIGHGL